MTSVKPPEAPATDQVAVSPKSAELVPPKVVTFTWTVKDILSPDLPDRLYSSTFDFMDVKWRLFLMPRGGKPAPTAGSPPLSLSLFLDLADADILPPGWRYNVAYTLSIVNRSKPADSLTVADFHSFHDSRDWGYRELISLATLADPAKGYIDPTDQSIMIHCTLEHKIPAPYSTMFREATWDSKKETGFVGLRNQGATCYMNSLLQTLFLTDRFRWAVYHMPTLPSDQPTKCIPLALQQLFYRLQFGTTRLQFDSARPEHTLLLVTRTQASHTTAAGEIFHSVATTDLTESFGWTTLDSFTQHDVQELNRVLMDNLLEKMKSTPMDGTVSRLFEGRMENYIRCMDVNYESIRDEPFFDLSPSQYAFRAFDLRILCGIRLFLRVFIKSDFSSVAERKTADLQVTGSIPSSESHNCFSGSLAKTPSTRVCFTCDRMARGSPWEMIARLAQSVERCSNKATVAGLETSFGRYIEPETLEGANAYRAEGFGLQRAKKGTRFTSLPPVLQLQLKRWDYDPERDCQSKVRAVFHRIETKPAPADYVGGWDMGVIWDTDKDIPSWRRFPPTHKLDFRLPSPCPASSIAFVAYLAVEPNISFRRGWQGGKVQKFATILLPSKIRSMKPEAFVSPLPNLPRLRNILNFEECVRFEDTISQTIGSIDGLPVDLRQLVPPSAVGILLRYNQHCFDSCEDLFDSLYDISRPKSNFLRTRLLSSLVFSPPPTSEQIAFSLEEHIWKFLRFVDGLKFPVEAAAKLFLKSFRGFFGDMVKDEFLGLPLSATSVIASR
ncbi:putative Ubiquitin carboxyl-terminal hydrolase 13 [Paratrimastix pyriformis]|uniref:Ubiquitin carboxyl-terminal hydrolase 13 n=1 Tax=Paratrimastix pyriformis TaxID=342808 RepID=A0ABQ8U731_9EUKA|nr:putative Ubiquitin carboxyl-terminal hydrolase 13 [Paratrimastix pyriformis]